MHPKTTMPPTVTLEPGTAHIAAFAARQLGVPAEQVRLRSQGLRGGLEAATVARWMARSSGGSGPTRALDFVVKRLDGVQRREAVLYAAVLPAVGAAAPALLGFEPDGPDSGYLYLEYVRAARAWPWSETHAAAQVLALLADLHARLPVQRLREPDLAWDYEAELAASAWTTLELFERVASGVDLAWLRSARGALRRICAALPEMRRALLSAEPFGTCVIHGDVHSGNTILAHAGEGERVVLLDWARARRGSPFEDVASWLQSLGYWEPEARRRHDTLLRGYLLSRGQPAELTRQLRDTYWLAAASNVLAGALRYHLAVAADRATAPSAARAEAARATRDQLRVLRRADLLWRA